MLPKPNGTTGQGSAETVASPPLIKRLAAWWEGYELTPAAKAAKPKAKTAPAPEPVAGLNRHGKPLWTATRLEVAEKIWGDGFVSPGGNDYMPTMVKPLGLNPAMSVLDLGAGLGGATRIMAGRFGAWVTGLEGSPFLVEQGMLRSVKAGLAKQAPVESYDPEKFRYPKRVDAIFSKEAIFSIVNKDGLFDGIEMALKPRGQFLFTDYIAEAHVLDDSTVKAWAAQEPLEPRIWNLETITHALKQRNLDLRICEDITEHHRAMILSAIQALTDHLAKHNLDKDTKINVMEEVQLWAMRVSALQRGLRCFRMYSLKPAE